MSGPLPYLWLIYPYLPLFTGYLRLFTPYLPLLKMPSQRVERPEKAFPKGYFFGALLCVLECICLYSYFDTISIYIELGKYI